MSKKFFHHRLILEIISGLFLSLLSLAVFIKITREVLEKDLSFLDTQIEHLIYSWRTPHLTSFMAFITQFGSTPIILIGLLITAILVLKKYSREALFFSTTLFSSGFLNLVLKQLFQLPRPSLSPLVLESSYSFPSGHATNSFVFYSLVTYLIFRFSHNSSVKITSTIITSFIIFSIGFSRIYLGVHHPSDVVGGFISGFWCLVTSAVIEKILIYRRLLKD